MTPLEEVEALCQRLVAHYGDGEDREVRAAAKLLRVAFDRMQRHGGPNWPRLVGEFHDTERHEPDKFGRPRSHCDA